MTDQTSARRLERRALLGMGLSAAAWLTGSAVLGAHAARSPRVPSTATAFWLATLTGSDAARKWLDGPRLRDILGPDDRWTTK